MAKKILVEVPVEGKEPHTNKSKDYKVAIIFLVVIAILLVVVLVVKLFNKKNDNVKDTNNNPKINDTKDSKSDYPLHHYVSCTNPNSNFNGYPFSMEFEYEENDLLKYTFAFYVDGGKELSEDILWNYVSKYEGKMPWKPDEKGFGLADNTNPYKYRIFYSLTADNYCKSLDGCDEIQLEFSHVKEMLVDFEEQLNVKCTVQ